jgi:hypothetical protein
MKVLLRSSIFALFVLVGDASRAKGALHGLNKKSPS